MNRKPKYNVYECYAREGKIIARILDTNLKRIVKNIKERKISEPVLIWKYDKKTLSHYICKIVR